MSDSKGGGEISRRSLGVAALAAGGVAALGGAAQAMDPMREWGIDEKSKGVLEREVRETVERHFAAVIKGDADALKKVWDADAGHVKAVDGRRRSGETVAVEPVSRAIERWAAQPTPDARGTVLSVDVVRGSMAMARTEMLWRGGRYEEFLILLRVNGQWRIVDKAYVAQARATHGPAY